MKAFYCGGTSSNYSAPSQFTTADDCPPMTNLTATTFNGNQAKVRFDWDSTRQCFNNMDVGSAKIRLP